MQKIVSTLLVLLGVWVGTVSVATAQAKTGKPRTIVTTDGEVDDVDSFIRLLLYSSEFDIVGLVYSSSQWHYAGDGKGTLYTSEMQNTAERYGERKDLRWPGTTWMQHHINQYGKVYNNLKQHAAGYPTPDYLLSLVKTGNIEFEGEMEKNTEGSNFIKQILLDDNPSPVYLQIWGGTNTVARALKSIEEEYKGTAKWEDVYKKVSEKAVIYAVLDQDATYQKYIAPNWPQVKVLYNSDQFWSFAYPWPQVVPKELQPYLGGKWFKENIKYNHGPLLAGYYLWGDGTQIENDPEHDHGSMEKTLSSGRNQYDFISEGDSPAFFYLVDVGLRSMEDASFGGWGGRMVQSDKNPYRWEDGKHVTDYNYYTNKADATFPQTRWVDVLQNDFAARADWCVMSYKEANHPPTVKLNQPQDIVVKPGQKVSLKGSAKDPDGNKLNYRWWQYEEVDTYKGKISIQNANSPNAAFTVPDNANSGETIHLILEVTDSGTPKLTRYQRVIATVIK
ncbi:nucleoside hydrolase-like domain-containing protein [Pontibacter toksunensis]|uniref:Nucleoside hydrolase-like domain-containing protein n=1 Tax=Pontibacter toksunensis TaxID=1332631 RepID=A0ABW6BQZ3_9BACT